MSIKKKIAVLVSGSGSNLQALIDALEKKELTDAEIAIVIASKSDAFALKRAEVSRIKNIFLNPSDFKTSLDFDQKLIEVIKEHNADLIVLAGFLRILSTDFIKAFKNKIINIHPSLLPAFGGKGMYGKKVHEAVINSKVKESGCTTHFVTDEVDTGQIILQKKVPVNETDTVESLSSKILNEEHTLLIESIKKVLFEKSCISK